MEGNGQDERRRATMRKIAAAACVVSICSASSVFAMDLVTKAPHLVEISQNSPSLQSFPGTGQQSFVFGDWGGLRSWLSNQGIDLGLSYLSEPAWDVAGGMRAEVPTRGRRIWASTSTGKRLQV